MATSSTDATDLQIRIDVATELLRRELNEANSQIARFASSADASLGRAQASFDRVGRVASTALGGIGVALGALVGAGILSGVRSITQNMDDLATSARNVGLSAERFQELQYSLERLDVSSETATAALSRLLVATGKATIGNEEAARTFRNVGLSIADLQRLNPGEVFDRVATGLGEIESPAERARIAAELFGREAGPQLAAALADGGAALRDWAAQAQNAGLIIESQTVDRLAAANDAIDQFTARANAALTRSLGAAAEFANDRLDLVNARLELIRSGKSALVSDEVLRGGGSVPLQPRRPARVVDFRDVEGPPPKPTKKGRARRQSERVLPTPSRPDIDGITAPPDLPDIGQRANDALNTIPDLSNDPAFVRADEAIREVSAAAEEARLRSEAFTDALSRGLADAVVNGGNFGEVLQRLVTQLLVIEPLTKTIRAGLDGLFGGSGGLLGSLFGGAGGGGLLGSLFGGGGGGAAGAGSGIQSIFAANSGFGGFFAEGGTPPLGKLSIVGERGPEFIVPRSPVDVVTAAQMARLGGGRGAPPTIVNQTLNFNTDRDSVRAQIQESAPLIAAASANAVDRRRRNVGITRK